MAAMRTGRATTATAVADAVATPVPTATRGQSHHTWLARSEGSVQEWYTARAPPSSPAGDGDGPAAPAPAAIVAVAATNGGGSRRHRRHHHAQHDHHDGGAASSSASPSASASASASAPVSLALTHLNHHHRHDGQPSLRAALAVGQAHQEEPPRASNSKTRKASTTGSRARLGDTATAATAAAVAPGAGGGRPPEPSPPPSSSLLSSSSAFPATSALQRALLSRYGGLSRQAQQDARRGTGADVPAPASPSSPSPSPLSPRRRQQGQQQQQSAAAPLSPGLGSSSPARSRGPRFWGRPRPYRCVGLTEGSRSGVTLFKQGLDRTILLESYTSVPHPPMHPHTHAHNTGRYRCRWPPWPPARRGNDDPRRPPRMRTGLLVPPRSPRTPHTCTSGATITWSRSRRWRCCTRPRGGLTVAAASAAAAVARAETRSRRADGCARRRPRRCRPRR